MQRGQAAAAQPHAKGMHATCPSTARTAVQSRNLTKGREAKGAMPASPCTGTASCSESADKLQQHNRMQKACTAQDANMLRGHGPRRHPLGRGAQPQRRGAAGRAKRPPAAAAAPPSRPAAAPDGATGVGALASLGCAAPLRAQLRRLAPPPAWRPRVHPRPKPRPPAPGMQSQQKKAADKCGTRRAHRCHHGTAQNRAAALESQPSANSLSQNGYGLSLSLSLPGVPRGTVHSAASAPDLCGKVR